MPENECEALLASQGYVSAMQYELSRELLDVIKTEFSAVYIGEYLPAVWCGSLVIQAVVGSHAPQV